MAMSSSDMPNSSSSSSGSPSDDSSDSSSRPQFCLSCVGDLANALACFRSSTSRMSASNRAMLLIFSSSLSGTRSLPGMQRIWKARSRIVSRGPGGVEATSGGCTADAILLLPLVCEDSADDRPCADVHPSIN